MPRHAQQAPCRSVAAAILGLRRAGNAALVPVKSRPQGPRHAGPWGSRRRRGGVRERWAGRQDAPGRSARARLDSAVLAAAAPQVAGGTMAACGARSAAAEWWRSESVAISADWREGVNAIAVGGESSASAVARLPGAIVRRASRGGRSAARAAPICDRVGPVRRARSGIRRCLEGQVTPARRASLYISRSAPATRTHTGSRALPPPSRMRGNPSAVSILSPGGRSQ